MAYFSRIEETLAYVHDLLELKKGDIGLNYVSYADEKLIPKYPAAVVAPGQTTSEVYATHQFKRMFYVEILIMHAKLTVSRAIRSRLDLEMVTRVVDVLHADARCSDADDVPQCIFSFVSSEVPQNISAEKNTPVIGTQLSWQADSRVAF